MTPEELDCLQNVQNLLQNGRPLNHRHPGYRKLPPQDREDYDNLIKQKKQNGGTLLPSEKDKLEKLAAAIQLESGPADLNHRGVPSLQPDDLDKFKDILAKKADKQPLTEDEKADLDKIKDVLRPSVPYDHLHPNFDKLSEPDQKKLLDTKKKLDSGKPLTRQEKADLGNIKAKLNDPDAVNEAHPGWPNLTPSEKDELKDLMAKKDVNQELTPEEEAEIDRLQDCVKNGRPIDKRHPGFDCLSPKQQDDFNKLNQMKQDGIVLRPEDNEKLNDLENAIRNSDSAVG